MITEMTTADANATPTQNRGKMPHRSWEAPRRGWYSYAPAALKIGLVILLIAVAAYRLKFAPIPVVTLKVTQGPIVAEVMGTGTLEARVNTVISARIQERLVEVLADQNDRVETGQLLAKLDDGELKQQVAVAEAELAAAQATLERVRVDDARAQAVEEQARITHHRNMDLVVARVTSQESLDQATEQLRVAQADVKRTQASILEAHRQMLTMEKNLAYRKERLSFTRIISPYDGLIVRRDRDPGDVVSAGSSILKLISTNEIWVSAWVDETAMAEVAAGQPARIVFRSEPGKSYPGEVVRLGRETDRETREFLVDVRVQALPKNWAVGQRAEVYLHTGRKADALIVPLKFISWRAGHPGVFVIEGGKARWREVKLGLQGLQAVEAVKGLSPGDTVCKAGGVKKPLLEGQRVSAL